MLLVLGFGRIQFEHQAQLVCMVLECRHPRQVTSGTITGPARVVNLVIRCHFVGEGKKNNNRLVKFEPEETKNEV